MTGLSTLAPAYAAQLRRAGFSDKMICCAIKCGVPLPPPARARVAPAPPEPPAPPPRPRSWSGFGDLIKSLGDRGYLFPATKSDVVADVNGPFTQLVATSAGVVVAALTAGGGALIPFTVAAAAGDLVITGLPIVRVGLATTAGVLGVVMS